MQRRSQSTKSDRSSRTWVKHSRHSRPDEKQSWCRPTFIKVLPARPLQPEFVDLVEDARDSLLREPAALLDSPYLYGTANDVFNQKLRLFVDWMQRLRRSSTSA
jgi:hypothetical protein